MSTDYDAIDVSTHDSAQKAMNSSAADALSISAFM